MLANLKYTNLPKHFWAHVKLLSEQLGYSDRGTGKPKIYSKQEIENGMEKLGLSATHLNEILSDNKTYIETVVGYLNYRSKVLAERVEPNLMDRNQAKVIFDKLRSEVRPKCKLIMNKQKGEKKHYSYLTCIVDILTEKTLGSCDFVQDPQSLVIATKDNKPLRTFTRRFDGVYPTITNPLAVWEIKEYYGTTTFGSRVADGVYETLLEGSELLELEESEKIHIKHYLVVDDHFTWWIKGKSYLCRIIDMLHMNFVNEVLFGKEVVERWPEIVRSWKNKLPGQ